MGPAQKADDRQVQKPYRIAMDRATFMATVPNHYFPGLPGWTFDLLSEFKEGIREHNKTERMWESYVENNVAERKRYGKRTALTRQQREEHPEAPSEWERLGHALGEDK